MTVPSNDGIPWLTKLERIGKRSARDGRCVFNNLGHLIDADLLKELYHRLDGNKAVGIDGVTKEGYGEQLDEHVSDLVKRLHRGTYQPKPARVTRIPKDDGGTRPLAISCVEDKLVQLAVSTLLQAVYEPLFLPCSYGFRPGRSCHDALRALNRATFRNWQGAVVEVDIRKCFDSIPHAELLSVLSQKISDRRFLGLVKALMTAPIKEGKQTTRNVRGCPQGASVSPVLANIYLHHVPDQWFESIKTTHFRGRAQCIRYADDLVYTFQHPSEAERFFGVLPKRLNKYGLEMHPEKSRALPAGHGQACRALQQGSRLPTFPFLGFTCYWGKTRNGYWRLKYTSRQDRFAAKLKGMRHYLRKHLTMTDTHELLKRVIRAIRGWVNYHGISDNARRVGQFLERCKRILYLWFNRRGGNRRMTWSRLLVRLQHLGYPVLWKTTSMFQPC
jgi:RNA-directed DNA polymerase